jgi:hypothetical protein
VLVCIKKSKYRSRDIALGTCSSLFAKARIAAALLQQEKNKTEDIQRGRVNITGFM